VRASAALGLKQAWPPKEKNFFLHPLLSITAVFACNEHPMKFVSFRKQ
jgi:hypothetical protein